MTRFMLLLLALATGCTTTCRIDSNAHGALVYLDGSLKGETPCDVELDDGKRGYTIKLEHPEFMPYVYQISQQYAGTVTQQQTNTNVQGQTNAYASPSGRSASTYTTAQGTQSTQTQQYHMYAWPTRFFCQMQRRAGGSTGVSTSNASAVQSQGAFCTKCGARLGDGTQFCGGCGTRR